MKQGIDTSNSNQNNRCARCGELTEFSRLCATCQQFYLDEFKHSYHPEDFGVVIEGDVEHGDWYFTDYDDYDYDNGDDYDYDEYGRHSSEINFGFTNPLDRIIWQAKNGNWRIKRMLRGFWRKIVHEIRWKFDKKYRISYDEIPF